MNAYRELFRLRLEHAYLGEGRFDGWRIEPSIAAGVLMRSTGMIVRREGNEAVFLLPDLQRERLRALGQGQLTLLLLIHAEDPYFASWTMPAVPPGSLLVADSRHAGDGAESLLHPSAHLDGLALLPADAPLCRCALDGVASPRQPALVVRIEPDAAAAPRCYVARFEAPGSYWKYYLAGALAARPVAITDAGANPAAAVTFHRVGQVDLERGRAAAVFRSDRAIALRERPGERFQLKEDGPFGERVLMKRMPVAGTGLRQREVIDGQVVQVSEIFINR